jgi:hypothetical protein
LAGSGLCTSSSSVHLFIPALSGTGRRFRSKFLTADDPDAEADRETDMDMDTEVPSQ